MKGEVDTNQVLRLCSGEVQASPEYARYEHKRVKAALQEARETKAYLDSMIGLLQDKKAWAEKVKALEECDKKLQEYLDKLD